MDDWTTTSFSNGSPSSTWTQTDASPTVTTCRRTRTSKPKVRTGCVTCKARRVKCDESQPECKQCIRLGRRCGGYKQSIERKPLQDTPAINLLLRQRPDLRTGTPAEIAALEFFHHQAAPQLASFFDADFWTRLVFQVSDAEDAIQHAIIALGSLARQQGEQIHHGSTVQVLAVQDTLMTPDPSEMHLPLIQKQEKINEDFALLHYNKAVAQLALRISDPDVPVEVVLLSCIIFVCLEFLRGNLSSALSHFRSGMNVMLSSLADKYAIGAPAIDRIRQNMLPFFNRLELLSSIMGNVPETEYIVALEDSVPKTLINMRQARDSLIHLGNHAIRLIRANSLKRYTNAVSQEDMAKRKALSKQLENWEKVFESYLLSDRITSLELDGARMLQMHLLVTKIWPSIAITPDETKNDEWNDHFEKAVSLAEVVQDSASRSRSLLPSFLFDMEIVSPLYFIVSKCRHPVIRRRATNILKQTSQREGLWDSQLAALLAERLMAFEEKNLTRLDGSELPEERDRIHTSHIEIGSSSDSNKQTFAIVHFCRPDGSGGAFKVLREEITVARIGM